MDTASSLISAPPGVMPFVQRFALVATVLVTLAPSVSSLSISTHNKTCTIKPPTNDQNWRLTSIAAIGDLFLLSADYVVTLTRNSYLFLVDPSSCTVLDSLQLPQDCISELFNTRDPSTITLLSN